MELDFVVMKRGYILLSLLILVTGCTATETDVSFKIENISSTNIFVQDVVLANNDTTTVQIVASETQIIWDVTNAEHATGNWYYDCGFQINYITNQAGDTIIFDPNVAGNWYLSTESSHSYYTLTISNTSF